MGAEDGQKKDWAKKAHATRTVSKRFGAGTKKNRRARAVARRAAARNRSMVPEGAQDPKTASAEGIGSAEGLDQDV